MQKIYVLLILWLLPNVIFAQHISLYHTGTQYDAFENPVQQSFIKDYSRKYAINLFPHLSGFINFKGDAETSFKKLLINGGFYDLGITNVGGNNVNYVNGDINTYLFTYRIFRTADYNRELGFVLQFKSEGEGNITNETLAIFDSYKNFPSGNYTNPFNSNGINQSYWQLGVTYRENYNDRWGFGAKLSLLNGTTYNKLDITESNLNVNQNTSFTTRFIGSYDTNFGFENLTYKQLLPNLKNIGGALSLAASYKTKNDFYFTANLKDLGFIRWGKKSYLYNFDSEVTILNPDSANSSKRLFDALRDDVENSQIQKSFVSKVNTKAEFAASKDFDFYKPVFVVSKSLFNNQGQIGLLNNFKKNAFVFSFNAIYDLQTKLNFGSQIMIKSPNAEFYLGSEHLFPTYYLTKSYITKNENIGRGNPKGDFYIGINVKFGPKMQNIGTADEIPGLNDKETGYVVRLGKKERKRLQKQNRAIEKRRNKNNKRNSKR